MTNKKDIIKKGSVFVISAPSGAGKTTVTNETIKRLQKDFDISKVATYTTRSPRDEEQNGKDYHFVSVDEFKKKQAYGFFLETTKYNGKYYGSPASILTDLKLGKSFVIVTDLEGVKAYSKIIENPVLIWINAPSIEELKRRLLKRGCTNQQLEERLSLAEQEMKEAQKPRLFDFIVINKVFDQTVNELMKIIKTKLA
jgi:guanylate kinase